MAWGIILGTQNTLTEVYAFTLSRVKIKTVSMLRNLEYLTFYHSIILTTLPSRNFSLIFAFTLSLVKTEVFD